MPGDLTGRFPESSIPLSLLSGVLLSWAGGWEGAVLVKKVKTGGDLVVVKLTSSLVLSTRAANFL